MNYEIRQAYANERDNILDFFVNEWKASQIIVNSELFRYYYCDKCESPDNTINFVIAKKCDQIVGACGFIYYNKIKKMIWLSNLLVKRAEGFAIIFDIMDFFKSNGFVISSVNVTPKSLVLYERLGFLTGELTHYYIPLGNNEVPGRVPTSVFKGEYLDPSDLLNRIDDSLFNIKSKDYFIKRFMKFPCADWKYEFWGIKEDNNTIKSLFVYRIQNTSIGIVLRIVDFYGDEFSIPHLLVGLRENAEDYGCKYIDFWCYGIDEKILTESGFIPVTDDVTIIPDRLDPVEYRNEHIYFFSEILNGCTAFRADGDNDRPNLVN